MCKTLGTHLKPLIGFFILLWNLSVFSQTLEIYAPTFKDVIDQTNVSLCASTSGNNFNIEFGHPYAFDENNDFIIELSDAVGDFSNGIEVATIFDSYNDFFNIQGSFSLPVTAAGEGYRLRIKSRSSTEGIEEVIGEATEPFEAYYRPDFNVVLNNRENVVLCNGNSQEISVTLDDTSVNVDDYEYVWFLGTAEIPGERGSSIIIDEEGTYSVDFYQGGCNRIGSSSIVVTESEGADDVFINGDSVINLCSNETYALEASINDASYTYDWYKDDVLLTSGYVPVLTTEETNQYGVYRLDLKTGSGGCEVSSQNVTIQPQDGAGFTITVDSATSRVILPTETIALNVDVEPTSTDLTYTWYRNGTPVSSGTTENQPEIGINIISVGEYYVEITDSSSSCSVVLESEVYTILAPVSLVPYIKTSEDYVTCNSLTTELDTVGVSALATDGVEYPLSSNQLDLSSFSYQWYVDGVLVTGEDLDNMEVSSYMDNGMYSLYASVGSGSLIYEGNSSTEEVLLSPGLEVFSSSVSNKLCSGSVINLSIDILTGYTYTWFKDDVEMDVSDVSSIDISEVGVYSVTYEGFGCSHTDLVDIVAFDEDVLQVDPETTAVLIPEETVVLSATGADSYEWYNELGSLLSTNETLEVSVTGIYTLIGSVGECQIEKEIEVIPDDGSYTIPNIITPFGSEGVNDTWEIPNKYSYQSNVQVIIYNSRGDEVYNITDYQNSWPEDNSNIRGGMLFYFKVIQDEILIKAGTISVLE